MHSRGGERFRLESSTPKVAVLHLGGDRLRAQVSIQAGTEDLIEGEYEVRLEQRLLIIAQRGQYRRGWSSRFYGGMLECDFDKLAAEKSDSEVARALVQKALDFVAHQPVALTALEYPTELQIGLTFDSSLFRDTRNAEQMAARICDAFRESLEGLGDGGFQAVPTVEVFVGLCLPLDALSDQLHTAVTRLNQTSLYNLVIEEMKAQAQVDEDERTRWLPSVVAIPYSLIDQQTDLYRKFVTALNTFDALVRYLTAVTLAPVRGETQSERLQALPSDLKGPLGIGRYARVLSKALDQLQASHPQTFESLHAMSDLGRFVLVTDGRENLTEFRNRAAHGGVPGSDARYVEPYTTLRTHLDDLLKMVEIDGKASRLVSRTGTDMEPGDEAAYDYALFELRGGSVAFPRTRIVTDEKLERDRVYLWNVESRSFTAMDPIIIFGVCPECHFQEGFFLDHQSKGEWISFRADHRVTFSDGQLVKVLVEKP